MNKQLRILILEDDNTDAELMEYELGKANFTFTSKRVETREAFQANLLDFAPDLILADYTLPSFDGCSALRIAKEKCPDVPFIFVSGTIGEDFAIESLKSGATDYILKDRLTRLAPAVHRAMREVEEKIEHRKAEKALKESELRFRSVVQSANDAIILMDGRGIIVSWNTGAQAMFGYMEKEVIGKSVSHIMPERYKKDHMKKIEYASLVGKPGINGKKIESLGLRKGGIEFPVEISMAKWKTEEGTFYSAIIRDITERRQVEEELRIKAQLLDDTTDSILVHDLDGNIIYINEGAYKSRGFSKEEMMGMNLREIVTPEHERLLDSRFKELIEKGEITFESAHFRKDKSIMPVESHPRIIESGGRKLVLSVIRDITERKRADEALSQSEEKYRILIDNMQEGVFILQDGKVQFVNESFARTAGYSMEEIPGRDFLDFIAPEDKERVIGIYSRRLAGENVPKEYELKILKKDGARIITNVNVELIKYRGRAASMGTIKDITERKRAEEKIEASLKEKEILLREIHHRVKNNMQIISSLLGLQAESIKEEKYLEMFRDSRNRIMSMYIIHEKLYRSRDLEKIEFNEYIRDLANGLLQSHGVEAGKVELNINVGDTSLGIDFAIPCGLIINELITNSLKYAFPDGRKGKISISLHTLDKNMFKLVVSDNGVGFPSDVDFRKTESLGLRLVTILAENQLHGKIDLDRTGGTEFTIKFKGVK
ncbi:MAG: PAS domain S-box protein [Candidatus Methanoperedens sp.]